MDTCREEWWILSKRALPVCICVYFCSRVWPPQWSYVDRILSERPCWDSTPLTLPRFAWRYRWLKWQSEKWSQPSGICFTITLTHMHARTHTYIRNSGRTPTPYVTFGQTITAPGDPLHCEDSDLAFVSAEAPLPKDSLWYWINHLRMLVFTSLSEVLR